MPTSHGVIQGYNNQAISDDKHQIIIAAEAMSDGQDHDNLEPMLDNAKENMKKIDDKKFGNAQKKIIELANQYYEDAKYYLGKKDFFTAFGCINYAHGLLDTIIKF